MRPVHRYVLARAVCSYSEFLTRASEQEITGDVLLELDANVLKSEIGIAAFGKRVRIMNAISELRRPPSVEEVEHPHEQQAAGSMLTPRSLTHSFNYPASNGSHRSHSHSHSVQSSAHQSFNNSPFGPPSPSALNGNGHMALAALASPESPLGNGGDLPGSPSTMAKTGWRASDPGSIHGGTVNPDEDSRGRSPVGLGFGLPSKGQKARPPQLMLSPSDSALGESGGVVQGKERRDSLKDDRAALSEVRVLFVMRWLSYHAEDNVADGGHGEGLEEQAPLIWSFYGLWVLQGEGRGEHTLRRDPSQLSASVSFAR